MDGGMAYSVILGLSLVPSFLSDSATITLRPYDKSVATISWVAFADDGRLLDRGVAPGETKQASAGVAVTYCAELTTGSPLELVVDVGGGQITAWARCTRVVVRSRAVETKGVRDPRLSAAPKRDEH